MNRSLDFSADDCKREKGDVKSKGNERSVLGPASEVSVTKCYVDLLHVNIFPVFICKF